MQVSHQNDHITHAVIGGKQAIEFGISNSAEFFNILSSTLYKDQILAVVREVLCNAWDAHIEAGCTDRAVQITLTNDTFTIKDFGKGIHHDDMGLIYGTYGNSTKKNDGNQTGGFGLGCKAPFAYTDHFEVVSSHAGIRTIYNLSKSSAQAMGKPGITPIASFPSDESGLTVTIRIKPQDHERFSTLIRRIAYNGDMNMQLNGEQLTTLDFDVSQRNFLLTRAEALEALMAYKKASKVSWEKLGLPDLAELAKGVPVEITVPVVKAPSQTELNEVAAKVTASVRKVNDVVLGEGSYKERIQKLLAIGLTSVGVAKAILELKKKSKKGWSALGVSDTQAEQITNLAQ